MTLEDVELELRNTIGLLEVRRAVRADLTRLLVLFNDDRTFYPENYFKDRVPPVWTRRSLEERLKIFPIQLVAIRNGVIVSWTAYGLGRKSLKVAWAVVDRNLNPLQRMAALRSIMGVAVLWAHRQGKDRVVMDLPRGSGLSKIPWLAHRGVPHGIDPATGDHTGFRYTLRLMGFYRWVIWGFENRVGPDDPRWQQVDIDG